MRYYTASKTKHAHIWRWLRDVRGIDVIATWIDEAGPGESADLADLARRCIAEAAQADVTILYAEPGDMLKGALMEMGAALAAGKPVRIVGDCDSLKSAVTNHPLVERCRGMDDAFRDRFAEATAATVEP